MDSERTLPHDLTAERALLGSALLGSEGVLELGLKPDDFFRVAHRRIFQAMLVLEEKRQALDFTTLRGLLERSGELEDVGGPAYLSALVDGMPRAAHVGAYAEIIKGLALRRAVIFGANRLAAEAYDGDSEPAQLVQQADDWIEQLGGQHGGPGLIGQMGMTSELLGDLEARFARGQAIQGAPTGFADLDALTFGLHRKDLILLAARPSMGKSCLAAQIAHSVAKTGAGVAYFSLEMSRLAVEYRLLAGLSSVILFRVLSGRLNEWDWARLSIGIAELGRIPLAVDDTGTITVSEIRNRARRYRSEQQSLGLVVVDYLQLLEGKLGHSENRTSQVAEISRRLKNLAKDLDVPVLALSQLSRPSEGKKRRPRLSDLKESGSLEQDADLVLFIHQDGDDDTAVSGPMELIIGKQRNGPTGSVEVTFEKEFVRFTDVSQTQARHEEQARALGGVLPDMETHRAG